jgi:hypothetical protein
MTRRLDNRAAASRGREEREQFMVQRLHAACVRLLAICAVAILPVFVGCGSQSASATASPGLAASASNPTVAAATSNGAGKTRVKLRPGARTVVLAKAGDRPYDKTFDDLRFDMNVGAPFKRSMLTPPIEAMSGQRIRIRGYILPTPQRAGIKQFVLVRDNQECCFGPGAALYDCILVEMKNGATAEFTIKPVAVEGVFEIREFVLGGKHLAIYHMDGETVAGS